MTRYTFVLLVCRAIGVLSAVYLLTHIVYAFDEVNWALDPGWSGKPPSTRFPFVVIAIALAIPTIGIACGLRAERIAHKTAPVIPEGDPNPILTSLSIAAVISGYLCIAAAGEAQLEAIHGWRLSSVPVSEWTRGHTGPILHDGKDYLELSAGYAISLGGIFAGALRRTRETQAT